jgi:hypothetical protein
MLSGMGAGELSPSAVDEALSAVQRTLDRLTQRGQHDAAFEIARAQFSASMRASWPGNLSAVASAIDRALGEGKLASLSDGEREELRRAADVLRAVPHP